MIATMTAQSIVEEIEDVIHEKINMMNEEGIIIASSDPNRLGQVHYGAKKILEEHLPEFLVTKDMENETMKEGINLPLIVENEVIGVIGITGSSSQVYHFGSIVQKMTEIMIQNEMQKNFQRYNRRRHYRFMEDWLELKGKNFPSGFVERGKALGIDIMKPYRVMVMEFSNYLNLRDSLEGQKLLADMEASIRHYMEMHEYLALREPDRQIWIIPLCRDEKLRFIFQEISELIEDKYHQPIICGFDSNRGDKYILQNSYIQAEKAAKYASFSSKNLFGYDDLKLELLLMELPRSISSEFVHKIFTDVPVDELAEIMHFLELYFHYNGSIAKLAEVLYIHKNTVQYKLKKLEKITGEDIRTAAGGSIYYVALECYTQYHGRTL